MQYVRFLHKGVPRFGVVEDDRVMLVEGSPFSTFSRVSVIGAIDDIQLLAPCQSSKIVCVGLNYRDHAQEFQLPIPDRPLLFIKPSGCVIGPEESILYPDMSKRVDFEGELAIVIGKRATQVSEAGAGSYILGYSCANDVTARDLQPKEGQWTLAKSFDTFCPIGPLITDEVDPLNLHIETRLNDAVMQSSHTGNLIFPPDFLVSYISQVMTLYPGDVIITGTPSGIGPMQVGDTVEVSIEGIGTLRNFVR